MAPAVEEKQSTSRDDIQPIGHNPVLRGIDNIFRYIEAPANLMTVSSLWIFDESLDTNLVHDALVVLAKVHPKYNEVIKDEATFGGAWLGGTRAVWRPSGLAIDNVVRSHTSKHYLEKGTLQELERYMAQVVAEPFDRSEPLWRAFVVFGLEGGGSALFMKAHHCMADGQGFILSLLQTTSAAQSIRDARQSVPKAAKATALTPSADILPIFKHLPVSVKRRIPPFILSLSAGILMLFEWLMTIFSGIAYALYVGFWTLFTFNRSLTYAGPQTVRKRMTWSRKGVPIDHIRVIRQAYGVTLNDVMLAAVSKSLAQHLKEPHDRYLQVLIPISVRPKSDCRFQNMTSGSWVWLPMDNRASSSFDAELIHTIHDDMKRTMASLVPAVCFAFMNLCGRLAHWLPIPAVLFYNPWIMRYFQDNVHGVITNVPGPTEPIQFAGRTVKEYLVFPPQTGKGGLGIGLLSYCGQMTLAIQTDDVNDSESQLKELADHLAASFVGVVQEMVEQAKLAREGQDKKTQ